ncbi:MAG TPA: Rieske 2Fe-2S domain-containing protein [Jatrophihabitantaceae bacterium]|nr:Rieske 2Fe-2S domain-containing protein [Jatrophihabitantaceae bacterium]
MSATASEKPAAISARKLDQLAERVERASALDGVGGVIAKLAERLLPAGTVRDLASGVPLGHPAHPLLVAVPIGSWTAASVLDLTGGDRAAARRLVGLGVLAALPAAITGANDWISTAGAERRVGLVHAALNDAAVMTYGASWLARRRGRHGRGAVLGLVAFGLTGAAGWLGGHLAYALGVGVDTTAFQTLPDEWTDACAEADVPDSRGIRADVADVPVLVARHAGHVIALADRCTHRGAPLHDGEFADGCVTCPWHGSRFALEDGTVRAGPATRPQPALDVRIESGRVQVRRRDQQRTLRANPVGV